MKHTGLLGLSLLVAASGLVACGSSSSGAGGNGAGAGPGTGGTATTTSTPTGTGGAGGTTSSSSSSSTGGTGGTTTTGGTPADHLLISEIGVQPADGEFIEIYNPTAAAVDLSKYYLSDNSAYYGIAAGTAWAPVGTAGTDFLAQFPAGTSLAPGAALVIATDATFEAKWSRCPDFILSTTPLTCTSGTAKAMVAPTNGGIGAGPGLISNAREMVVLFTWDGVATKVTDVDYVTWGAQAPVDAATRIDKTAVSGYQPDTAIDAQKFAPEPGTNYYSIERCSLVEEGEKTTGGNGLDGHDVTSESFDKTFTVQTTPTPGVKNACL